MILEQKDIGDRMTAIADHSFCHQGSGFGEVASADC